MEAAWENVSAHVVDVDGRDSPTPSPDLKAAEEEASQKHAAKAKESSADSKKTEAGTKAETETTADAAKTETAETTPADEYDPIELTRNTFYPAELNKATTGQWGQWEPISTYRFEAREKGSGCRKG